ncbi:FHA domain-containing protein [Curtobacterium flaccumfaciens]|nr:FHA domain-containing protein [Curtobacterium flaccumfaciens]
MPSIRVGDRVLRLDRPVIVGRRPALPRIVRGPTPELVTLPSPSGQVSSSHLLVRAEGEAVVVEDLRSTNGTVVRPAGVAPFRMAAGGSNVVLTGTVVEIGDGNVIEVLSPHLRVAPSSGDLPPLPTWPSHPPAGTPRTPESDPET